MSVDDYRHVVVTVILRKLCENPGDLEALDSAEMWLRENPLSPEITANAVHMIETGSV